MNINISYKFGLKNYLNLERMVIIVNIKIRKIYFSEAENEIKTMLSNYKIK